MAMEEKRSKTPLGIFAQGGRARSPTPTPLIPGVEEFTSQQLKNVVEEIKMREKGIKERKVRPLKLGEAEAKPKEKEDKMKAKPPGKEDVKYAREMEKMEPKMEQVMKEFKLETKQEKEETMGKKNAPKVAAKKKSGMEQYQTKVEEKAVKITYTDTLESGPDDKYMVSC